MAVRVMVTVTAPSAESAAALVAERIDLCRRTEAEEEGCLQYEVFHSAVHPERYLLCELWSDRAIYDKHWQLQREREAAQPPKPPPDPAAPQRKTVIEFYEQAVYKNVDGVWMPADEAQRSVHVRWR
jgi:quinol monooxygenase YgiN